MERAIDVGRSPAPATFEMDMDSTPPRWRVVVDVEFVLEAEDQEAAIVQAEDLFRLAMRGSRLPRRTKVEVVMSLPVPVGSSP